MQLQLSCATQSLDITSYMDVVPEDGMDPANPSFTDKVFARSLLKEGGTLALESFQIRELAFPLRITSTSSTATVLIEQQINQIINTPGAVAIWQDDGMTQPTYFDLASGQFDIEYNYRAGQQHLLSGKLRLFAQPLGRTSAPRAFAAASGVGPLLMISPYASSGQLAVSASTQAGVAGFGGQQQPSGGVFYWGNPSLAGDAPAMLQISYVGPLGPSSPGIGAVPFAAISVLPDQNYTPLFTAAELHVITPYFDPGAVASTYGRFGGASPTNQFYNFSLPVASVPATWAGSHRLFAIARASGVPQQLVLAPGGIVPFATNATVYPGDWQLTDLGVISLRANEPTAQSATIAVGAGGGGSQSPLDLTAVVMLPESSTLFLNPTAISPSGYGGPNAFSNAQLGQFFSLAPYSNTLLVDDYLTGDQFVYNGPSQQFAPSPPGMSTFSGRITPYTRGTVARPDPRYGLPVIAILGVGQAFAASSFWGGSVAWLNPQNQLGMAQVTVVERTRYVLP